MSKAKTPLQPEEENVVHAPALEAVTFVEAAHEFVEDEALDSEPYFQAVAVAEVPRPAMRSASLSDPLEPFMALSAEEKIALFT